MRRDLYSIGDFSQMSRLSVKALRLYDEQGLFKPGYTDPKSGYRYYSSAQLPEANMIRKLRSLELPLEDIRRFLKSRDAGEQKALLEKHREMMERRLNEYGSIIAEIERLTEGKGDEMERKIETKELVDQPVLGVRFKTSLKSIGNDLGKAYGAIFTYVGKSGAQLSGPAFAIYHDMEYKEEDLDVEAGVPVESPQPGDENVVGSVLPGGKAASTMHAGPYEEIGDAYQAMMLWIRDQGLKPAGPCREVYLVGPQQGGNPEDYRTEILCPVEEAG